MKVGEKQQPINLKTHARQGREMTGRLGAVRFEDDASECVERIHVMFEAILRKFSILVCLANLRIN